MAGSPRLWLAQAQPVSELIPTSAGIYVTTFTKQGQMRQVLHQELLLLQLLEHYQLPKYAVAGASCQSTADLD